MIQNIDDTIYQKLNIKKEDLKIYNSSYNNVQNVEFLMVSIKDVKYIAVWGNGPIFDEFEGELQKSGLKLCPLAHNNRLVLNKYVDHTNPKAFGKNITTFGVGDRLGLATPGHIRTISKSMAKPILAQQSKRELDFTGRTYRDVLDDVSFAVFQEGYKGDFGADGDHLKVEADILDALHCGYTMITLDCSEKIGKGIDGLSPKEAASIYHNLPLALREHFEFKYLKNSFHINGYPINFTKEELIRNVLIYHEAISYITHIYKDYIVTAGRPIDFEISLDETESITSAYGHLLVASEIIDAGVNITSLAPRFVGDFQKGIDYIGNHEDFEKHLKIHAAIADFYGYKISIHSGSDKFSLYHLISLHTKGRLHIKTSGTSWLEALGTIAQCNPSLYRKIHKCALKHFEDAKKLYHVTTDLSNVLDIDTVDDQMLQEYLKDNNSRQLLHITYGYILQVPEIKTPFFETLHNYKQIYMHRLGQHIGNHLGLLGL